MQNQNELDKGFLSDYIVGLLDARKKVKEFLKINKDHKNYDKLVQVSDTLKEVINSETTPYTFKTTKIIRVIKHNSMENKFLSRDYIKSLGTMTYTLVRGFDENSIIMLEDGEKTMEDIKYHFPIGQNIEDFHIAELTIEKDITVKVQNDYIFV